MCFLHQLCFIDHELEVKAEGLGCLFAELHSFEEDLEVVHYRAELGVNGELELDDGMCFVDLEFCFLYRVVYTVVDVEC